MSLITSTPSRRTILKAGAVVPLAGYLAACGGGSKGGGSGGKASTLSMSDWWGGQFAHFYPTMQKLTGTKIKEQLYSYAPEKLVTQLASGTAPDFFLVDASWNGEIFPHSNLVASFDAELKKLKLDMSKWAVDPHKEVGFDGKIYGLEVMTTQDVIMMVNKPMAQAAGLLTDLPVWGKSTFDTWKWPQLIDWFKAATKRKADGTVETYGVGNVSTQLVYQALLGDMGGAFFDDPWNYGEKKCTLDSDAGISAAQLVVDLFRTHKVAAPPSTETAIKGGTYLAKRAVSTFQYSTPSAYPEADNFPMAYFHMPFVDKRVHALGANHLCVNAKGKHIDQCIDWIVKFCTDPTVKSEFLKISSVPAYDALPTVNAAPAGTPKTIALINLSRIKGMSTVPADAADVNLYPRWLGRYASGYTLTALAAAFDQVILNGADVKTTWQGLASNITDQITEGRRDA